jgi:hypothetical protein
MFFASAAAIGLAACQGGDNAGAGPVLPPDQPQNPQYRNAAFIFDVNTATKTVKVTEPSTKLNLAPGIVGGPNSISFSIIAGDVIQLTTSNYAASTVGQFAPNKIRVTFDVSLTNKLASVQLITPTFPTPPAGVTGVLLFPYSTTVTTTSGGVSVGGDGTDVIIEQPNRGQTAPSIDWNGDGSAGSGAPFNFFNDADCSAAGANDCYRWEAYASPLAAGATSLARTVGFDIDPTVANFRARLIVAADLQNSGPAPVGTVAGTVTSPSAGAIIGAIIAVTPGAGLTGTSGAGGAYSIANVPTGPKTVAITGGLPAGCTIPASQSATISNGVTSTVNFTVTCPAPSGGLSGTITRTGAGTQSLAGLTVTATPAAAGTSTSSGTSTGAASPFAYSLPAVQIGLGAGAGNGSVALSNLPAGCTNPGAGSYTGLTAGGSAIVNFTVDCIVPPAFYQLTESWGPITAGQVVLTISFDPTTRNDPAINGAGADDFSGFVGNINYGSARLTTAAGACVKGANAPFDLVFTVNLAFAPQTLRIVGAASGNGATTPVTVATCTFTVGAGTATTITTATSGLQVSSFNGGANTNISANTQVTEGSLSIP